MTVLTKAERDALVRKARELNARLYPQDGTSAPEGIEASRIREAYYLALAEYADRLPRVLMGACPFTGQPFKNSFDPWGVDGYWWQEGREFDTVEPQRPTSFKVLLGALAFHGRTPTEATSTVIPGPEVPFLVPRLLELPGMVAVVSSLSLETGDTAYPISYYSQEEIPPEDLHQFWLQQDFWFKQEEGGTGWIIANDPWDFDLRPWIEKGKLRWIPPGDTTGKVIAGPSAQCPYLDLAGDRFPQCVAEGERSLMELPDGTPVDPFGD